jgi:hypothetical protein
MNRSSMGGIMRSTAADEYFDALPKKENGTTK